MQADCIPEKLSEERRWNAAEIVANHLLADTFACDEELGSGSWSAVEKLARDQVRDSSFRIPAAHTSAT